MRAKLALGLLLLALSAGGWGADLTVVAPGCTSWSLSGSTLTCAASGTSVPPAPPVVPPAPPVVSACAGFEQTLRLDAAWPSSNATQRSLSSALGQFGDSTALVVKFTTGAKLGWGRITVAEYGSAPTTKVGALSTNACEFANSALGVYAATQGVTLSFNFTVGPNVYGYPALQPSTTYYLNVKNAPCTSASCDVFVDLKSP